MEWETRNKIQTIVNVKQAPQTAVDFDTGGHDENGDKSTFAVMEKKTKNKIKNTN